MRAASCARGRTGRVARRMGRDGRAASRPRATPPRASATRAAPAMPGCAPACTTSPRERFIHPGDEKRALGERAIRCQQAGLLRRHPRHREGRGAVRRRQSLPALFMKAEPGIGRARADRRRLRRHGQLQGDERAVLRPRVRGARLEHARDRRAGTGRVAAAARHSTRATTTRSRAAPRSTSCCARADVDPQTVVVMGYSFGGYYAARVAAFEPRYAAGVAFSRAALGPRRVPARGAEAPAGRPEGDRAIDLPLRLDHGLPRRPRGRDPQGRALLARRRRRAHHDAVPDRARRRRQGRSGGGRAPAVRGADGRAAHV